jgi:hypothetical protein
VAAEISGMPQICIRRCRASEAFPLPFRYPVIISTLRERAPYRVFEFFTANTSQLEHARRLCPRGRQFFDWLARAA